MTGIDKTNFVPGHWEEKEPWRVVNGKLAFKSEEHELIHLSGENRNPLAGNALESYEKIDQLLERLNKEHPHGFEGKENEITVQRQGYIINKKSASSSRVSQAAKNILPKTKVQAPQGALSRLFAEELHKDCVNLLTSRGKFCKTGGEAAKAITTSIAERNYTNFMVRPTKKNIDKFIVTIAEKDEETRRFFPVESEISAKILHKLLTNAELPETGIYDAVYFIRAGMSEGEVSQ